MDLTRFKFLEYYIGIHYAGNGLYAVCGRGSILGDWTINEWCTAEEIGQILGGN